MAKKLSINVLNSKKEFNTFIYHNDFYTRINLIYNWFTELLINQVLAQYAFNKNIKLNLLFDK